MISIVVLSDPRLDRRLSPERPHYPNRSIMIASSNSWQARSDLHWVEMGLLGGTISISLRHDWQVAHEERSR
ncbi:hypothetical protein [Chamaesiphon sp.]|uniref:hypothetical protein n=1 Tax=Chamaesiphon sp. TaxID=2814140 RepID=UPI00359312AE